MKKMLSVAAVLMLICGLSFHTAADELLTADVWVSISDQGTLVVTDAKVTAEDTDGDGTITIDEVLRAAHDAFYEGGAEEGYGSENTDWGLSITKLWGNESGNFGYYQNNMSAWSLSDPVGKGDRITAFIYQDGEGYSDKYCWFKKTGKVYSGKEVTLTLLAAGYDDEWNPVTVPVEGAVITVNGEETDAVTDENGQAVIVLEGSGKVVISAVSEDEVLVPPVLTVDLSEATTGRSFGIFAILAGLGGFFLMLLMLLRR